MKIEKCPFCGGEAEIVGGPENWTPPFYDPDSGGDPIAVVCKTCACGLHFFDDYAEAIAAWNRRTGNDTNAATNADRIRAKNDKELAEISVYCTTEPDYDEGLDGEWYECGEFEIWHSVFTADTYGSEEDAIAYTLDWLKQPVKEELM